MDEVVYRRESGEGVFEIVETEGVIDYTFDIENKDRLYKMRVTQIQSGKKVSTTFSYSHEDQLALLGFVIRNVQRDYVRDREIKKFRDALNKFEMEGKKKWDLTNGILKEKINPNKTLFQFG